MQLTLRLPKSILVEARHDLARPHAFAFERVGFFGCRPTTEPELVVISGYYSVPDVGYVKASNVGACINAMAIQAAVQRTLTHTIGQIHVHWHEHYGKPEPSQTDLWEQPKLIQSFKNVNQNLPHGIMILSNTHAWGMMLLPGARKFQEIHKIGVVSGGVDFL